MALEVRVKDDHAWPTIRAFAGREITKDAWVLVPEDREDEAERHPFLDVREVDLEDRPEGFPHRSQQSSADNRPADRETPEGVDGGDGDDEGPSNEVAAALDEAGISRSEHFASLLIEAGLDTVSKVRGSERSDLTAISGIGNATADKILEAVGADLEV